MRNSEIFSENKTKGKEVNKNKKSAEVLRINSGCPVSDQMEFQKGQGEKIGGNYQRNNIRNDFLSEENKCFN